MKANECVHMKSGINIASDGSVRLCCFSGEEKYKKDINIEDIEDLTEYFNSEYYINIRNHGFHENKLCSKCVKSEIRQINSLRQLIKTTYDSHNIDYNSRNNECKIQHLDISFSNLCNLQCLMCSSNHSSRWYNFDKKYENTKYERIPKKYKKWTHRKNMEKIIKLLPDLKLLAIKGGEPLIQEEVKEILSYIKQKNLNLNINIVTNFQEISEDVLKIICDIKKLSLTISLDSVGDKYNWIRNGNWEKTINNIEKFVVSHKHIPTFGYANTLNRWSTKNLVEDIKYLETINSKFVKLVSSKCNIIPWYNITLATGPEYVSPFLLTRQERLDVVYKFEKEFGFISDDFVQYKSMRINHLKNILALEIDHSYLNNSILTISDDWEKEIYNMRNSKND